MERVSTLIKKLQRQLDENATASVLLHTAQMLQAELQYLSSTKNELKENQVSVILPSSFHLFSQEIIETSKAEANPDEKIVEVLQVDEKEIEEELEQIKRNAETFNSMGSNVRPPVYDPLEDVPTLTQQAPKEEKKTNEEQDAFEYPESLNERLKEIRIELSEKLTEAPIKDLKKAIDINDRFLFINELFRGDEDMYERSIKTIQNFKILAEAEYWIRRELKIKIGWQENDPAVKQFNQLVRRRFS